MKIEITWSAVHRPWFQITGISDLEWNFLTPDKPEVLPGRKPAAANGHFSSGLNNRL